MKLVVAGIIATFTSVANAASFHGSTARRGGFNLAPLTARASTCNGDTSLCDKKYSNVTFIGSHNSYAISGENAAAEQTWNVTQQLDAGVRMLQAQAHKSNSSSGSGVDLCHSSCSLFDGGSLEDWLGEIKTWSDANPNEVLNLLLVNQESIAPSKLATAFNSSGISSLAWEPSGSINSKSEWPTLGSMIDSGKRIVTYLSDGADDSVPYLLSEFSQMWESPYDQKSLPFNCSIDRSGKGASTGDQMYLINHYKDQTIVGFTTPDKSSAEEVNSKDTVLQDADSCASSSGKGAYPNFILIDFVGTGNSTAWQGPFQAAAQMNGISYSAPTVAGASGSSGSNHSGANRLVPSSLVAMSFVLAAFAASI